MKELYSILILILTTTTVLSQSSFELSYDLKEKLKNEVNDSSEQFIQEWYARLDSLPISELTLGKAKFDSIVLVEYDTIEREQLIIFWGNFFDSSKVEYEKERYSLSVMERQTMVDFLNNPNNYDWSECGSPIAEYELQFFNEGELLLRIVISCDCSQVHLSIKNEITKYGALNKRGSNSTLLKLIEEIKTTANNTYKQ